MLSVVRKLAQPLSPAVIHENKSYKTNSPSASLVTVIRCMCVVAMATISGWRFLHSELLIVWLLFEGGIYSEIQYFQACPTCSQTWAHPLVFELTIVRVLWPTKTCPDWKLSTVPEKELLQRWEEHLLRFFGKKKEKWLTQCWPRDFTASHNSGHVVLPGAWLTPPLPIPLFLLVQNLSSKWVAPR